MMSLRRIFYHSFIEQKNLEVYHVRIISKNGKRSALRTTVTIAVKRKY